MLNTSSSHDTETDGQTEVVNRCLEAYLRCFALEQPKEWSQWIHWAKLWYNPTFHVSTGTTPFEAMYGRKPPTVVRYLQGETKVKTVAAELVDRDKALCQLKYHLNKAQEQMKSLEDKDAVPDGGNDIIIGPKTSERPKSAVWRTQHEDVEIHALISYIWQQSNQLQQEDPTAKPGFSIKGGILFYKNSLEDKDAVPDGGNDIIIGPKTSERPKSAVWRTQHEDVEIHALISYIWQQSNQLQQEDPTAKPGFSIKGGILFYKNRLVIPANSSLIEDLIKDFDSSPSGGHSGYLHTYRRMPGPLY
uniref:Uncharacterized protein LOC101502931 n=1 Tax=Cicer arietinum TaxID=3827 RepID=A0A1S2YWX2_CICAR|nr:uncharacterized protein LOC101502931 [Cicer arietinum]